jgi:tetratricopeptide (TPR) repeat protein
VREDHLRYMQKWGLIRPADNGHGETVYAFSDLAMIRQADEALADGASFRAVLRNLLASRAGQLTFDFRLDAQPAKVLQLKRRELPPLAALMDSTARVEHSSAEQFFRAASVLDDGDPANFEQASAAYRRALEIDPYLVPALINLANIHYARDEIAEAQALYERAIALEPDVFEAHFNLGNIFHDLGRYAQAQGCYRDALKLNPSYADAHFYLAVTLEKNGQSPDARAHWRAYQQLAPNGEWVDLAKEFSD